MTTRPALIVWLAVLFLLFAGFALWILEKPEVCIAAQVIDYQSHTVYPVECS